MSDDAPHRDEENRGKASGKRCDICRRLPTGKTLLLVRVSGIESIAASGLPCASQRFFSVVYLAGKTLPNTSNGKYVVKSVKKGSTSIFGRPTAARIRFLSLTFLAS